MQEVINLFQLIIAIGIKSGFVKMTNQKKLLPILQLKTLTKKIALSAKLGKIFVDFNQVRLVGSLNGQIWDLIFACEGSS